MSSFQAAQSRIDRLELTDNGEMLTKSLNFEQTCTGKTRCKLIVAGKSRLKLDLGKQQKRL
jgi:hypothetical protein